MKINMNRALRISLAVALLALLGVAVAIVGTRAQKANVSIETQQRDLGLIRSHPSIGHVGAAGDMGQVQKQVTDDWMRGQSGDALSWKTVDEPILRDGKPTGWAKHGGYTSTETWARTRQLQQGGSANIVGDGNPVTIHRDEAACNSVEPPETCRCNRKTKKK